MPRGCEWQGEKAIDKNTDKLTHTIGRVERRGNFAFTAEIDHSKFIVCMLIIDQHHLDKKGHGL